MDKAKLLAGSPGAERDVHIVELDDVVRVRGLTRRQVVGMAGIGERDDNGDLTPQGLAEVEAYAIHHGMVAPALTLDEAQQWVDTASSGSVQPVITVIRELSGLGQGAAKSRVAEARD